MFLHPWAIGLGVLAIGLPVAVHWLTKARPVRMPLSTLKFVRQSLKQRQARHRLRDFLILSLRTLAVSLVALAIARPRFGEQPLVSDATSGAAARVVVLDVSQSMAATDGGVARMERARSAAQNYLRYKPGLRANLILAGATPNAVFERLSQNFDVLRDELSKAEVKGDRLDINQAIERAAELLAPYAEGSSQRLELVVVSDFQRSNWARADFSILPEKTNIQLESASAGDTPANLGILDAQVRSFGAAGGDGELEVVVGNYSRTPRPVTVEVTIADAAFQLKGTCPAGTRTTLSQVIRLPKPGWQVGEARLLGVEDALAADNTRGLATEVRRAPTYALITREGRNRRPSSGYFLEKALEPLEGVRLDPTSLDRTELGQADLLVIDHPGKLEDEDIGYLGGLLRRGRGMLYVSSEPIDATNLQLLVDKLGGGLQMPVQFTPPSQATNRSGLFLASYRAGDVPFRVFGESVKSMTEPLRFAGGLTSRRIENSLDDDLLATYSDGSACLVLTSSDAGKLAVLNTDLARSNLPTSAAFVPLLDQLVQRLLEGRDMRVRATPGEPLVVRLPSEASVVEELSIQSPSGETSETEDVGELASDSGGVLWRWTSPEEPGVYRVVRGDETVFALPVAADAEESALESLSPDVLTERLAGGRASHFRAVGSADPEQDTLWTWLLVGCMACIVGEVATLIAFKS
ncbi:vWA domain-containing protein [Aeoliella sp.]|uniref:vWA domain-containing protein n=1 Tax=Aeoliella sp. TaxID=2795800 RepID=UPI003CCC3997